MKRDVMRRDTMRRDTVGRDVMGRDVMGRDTGSLINRILSCGLPILIMAAAWLIPALAFGQVAVACKLQDPELQGSYSGGCKDDLAEGYGVASGTAQYQGEFKAGRKHGQGVKTWSSGDRYEGSFVEDRKDGNGAYIWGSRSAWAGETYSGGYRNDRRHGHGVYEWPGGDRYAGPWVDDAIAGPATQAMMARARAHAERAAVVGVRGARVCREFNVGIAIRDRVRGTVTAVDADLIEITIEDPGRFQHSLGNVLITKTATIRDLISSWFPCN